MVPSTIPDSNTLIEPYDPIDYNYLYYILTDQSADESIKKQALELLAQDYVICLQPHPSYVVWCFQRLLLAWYSNDVLTKGIHKVCILINFKRAEPASKGNGGINEDYGGINEDYGIMPVILIVPKYGGKDDELGSSRDIAFTILRILNDSFFSYNDVAWTGSYPTYFKSISPLIWYAHGDGVYNALKRKYEYCNDTSNGSIPVPSIINANIEPTFLFEPVQPEQNSGLCSTDTQEVQAMQVRIAQDIQKMQYKQRELSMAQEQQREKVREEYQVQIGEEALLQQQQQPQQQQQQQYQQQQQQQPQQLQQQQQQQYQQQQQQQQQGQALLQQGQALLQQGQGGIMGGEGGNIGREVRDAVRGAGIGTGIGAVMGAGTGIGIGIGAGMGALIGAIGSTFGKYQQEGGKYYLKKI
jgi:hypothetical protein